MNLNWNNLLLEERIRKSSSKDLRNGIESDYGRIIYSPALRRMHDKTQVFPLTLDDNIHSRLTHSNEVMSIGYTLGIKLCEDQSFLKRINLDKETALRKIPILLQNVCLIHDIGNAPFGHFAEKVISEYFHNLNNKNSALDKGNFYKLNDHEKNDFLFYDGNAQGLRVLTKLQFLEDTYGLNLTYATLASYLKYPNYFKQNVDGLIDDKTSFCKVTKNITKEGKSLSIAQSKHGVFSSELNIFNDIVEKVGLKLDNKIIRHPLCFLMEAADSIAYYMMDVEDGFNMKLITIDCIKKQLNKGISDQILKDKFNTILDKEFISDNTKIVQLRIAIIQHLVDYVYQRFIDNIDLIEAGNFNEELLFGNDTSKSLENICLDKIFGNRDINSLETTGYSVITGLLDYYIKFIFSDNEQFQRRATALISKTIIATAIEENFISICESKIPELDIEETKKKEHLKNLKEFKLLLNGVKNATLSEEEKLNYEEIRFNLFKYIKPNFIDLSPYYKFRVIVDFISGMTDQYALKHFQKISGQAI